MIHANETLGHVAAVHPTSTLVFLRHRWPSVAIVALKWSAAKSITK
jgi:hypothetical protein